MRKTDLAYVAGIVDGEGCIGLYLHQSKKRRPFYVLQVTVANTNEWLIQWLKFSFGGSVHLRICDEPTNCRPQWYWIIAAKKALEFLMLVSPYLRLKKPQAEIAVRFQEAKRHRGRPHTDGEIAIDEAERILMASLNKRGAQ